MVGSFMVEVRMGQRAPGAAMERIRQYFAQRQPAPRIIVERTPGSESDLLAAGYSQS